MKNDNEINWFTVNRDLLHSDRWLSETFTRGQAWVDLFGLANFKDSYFMIRGIKVEVKRGQLAYSQVSLAKRWKWSRDKVRRWLGHLESDGDIIQQNNEVTTVITVLKYDYWQQTIQQTIQQKNSRKTSNDTHTNNNNKDNKDNSTPPKRKLTPKQKQINADLKELFKYYEVKFKEWSGAKASINYPACYKNGKKHMEAQGLKKMKELIDIYLQPDDFFEKVGWNLSFFLKAEIIQKLNIKLQRELNSNK